MMNIDRTNVLIGGGQKLKNPNSVSVVMPMIIGIIVFITIYGITPLHVTNDKWIMAGYDESDIIQHYAGWVSFRNSDWSFPIGLASDMACEDGTYISYTDSIPWVAIFFKIFRHILPDTFQYFGIYTLICFILQNIAAFKIIYLKSKDFIFSIISMLFFSFAPIELERAMRHTGLGSQWLILFAIYVFMKHRREYNYKHYLEYLLLLVLAIGIHPYFLPMIAVFTLFSVIDDFRSRKYISAVYMAVDLVLTYLTGCILGVLGTGISISRGGYGYFSMNINAILNPKSCGGYTWSSWIKTYPQILGNYDGFNYLGVGAVLAICLSLILIVFYGNRHQIVKFINNNLFVILGLMICTIFAISNVATFNDKTIFTINLPETIATMCGIFRASSRIFYPVYYCLYAFMICVIWKYGNNVSRIKTYIVITLLFIIQIYDIHGCVIEKHQRMDNNSEYISILDDDNVKSILDDNIYVVLDNFNNDKRKLAVVAAKEHCKLYYSVANSGTYERTYTKSSEILDEIKNTGNMDNNVVVTTDWNTLKQYIFYEMNGYYVYAGQYFIATDLNGTLNHVADGYTASSLSDDNWTNGINNSCNNIILFTNYQQVLDELEKASFIKTDSYSLRIVDIDYDENWIRVTVDGDATNMCYPKVLLFE